MYQLLKESSLPSQDEQPDMESMEQDVEEQLGRRQLALDKSSESHRACILSVLHPVY
jgi:hypothetical protein